MFLDLKIQVIAAVHSVKNNKLPRIRFRIRERGKLRMHSHQSPVVYLAGLLIAINLVDDCGMGAKGDRLEASKPTIPFFKFTFGGERAYLT